MMFRIRAYYAVPKSLRPDYDSNACVIRNNLCVLYPYPARKVKKISKMSAHITMGAHK